MSAKICLLRTQSESMGCSKLTKMLQGSNSNNITMTKIDQSWDCFVIILIKVIISCAV